MKNPFSRRVALRRALIDQTGRNALLGLCVALGTSSGVGCGAVASAWMGVSAMAVSSLVCPVAIMVAVLAGHVIWNRIRRDKVSPELEQRQWVIDDCFERRMGALVAAGLPEAQHQEHALRVLRETDQLHQAVLEQELLADLLVERRGVRSLVPPKPSESPTQEPPSGVGVSWISPRVDEASSNESSSRRRAPHDR